MSDKQHNTTNSSLITLLWNGDKIFNHQFGPLAYILSVTFTFTNWIYLAVQAGKKKAYF